MTTTTPSNEKTVPPVVLPVDLRDYFAAKALSFAWEAEIAEMNHYNYGRCTARDVGHDLLAKRAYLMADAMLKARATR